MSAPSCHVIQVALDCSHAKPAPAELRASTGKEWETVKPLGEYFKRLHRVLLIDADAFKVRCTGGTAEHFG